MSDPALQGPMDPVVPEQPPGLLAGAGSLFASSQDSGRATVAAMARGPEQTTA